MGVNKGCDCYPHLGRVIESFLEEVTISFKIKEELASLGALRWGEGKVGK